jgi:hypothetical protein
MSTLGYRLWSLSLARNRAGIECRRPGVELALRHPGLDREETRPMRNLPNLAHPPWCLRGPDCAPSGGLHLSGLVNAAPRGDEVIQIGAGLWRMDVGPSTAPGGVLLELSAGDHVERWPIDLAQSANLVPVLTGLLRRAAPTLTAAA